jgi:predicted phosphodiesterase
VNVLALYDIHGNIDALEAVLADATGADAVLGGGDVVPGPFAREALDRLGQLDVPVHWVRGNGEREEPAAERRRPLAVGGGCRAGAALQRL